MNILLYLLCFGLGLLAGGILLWLCLHRRLAQLPVIEQKAALEKESLQAVFNERLAAQEMLLQTERENQRRREDEAARQAELNRAEMEKVWLTRIELMKEEFKTLSEKILKEKSGALTEVNKDQVSALLQPLEKELQEFKQAVESSKEKGIEMHSKLGTFLQELMQTSRQVGKEANQLTMALKGNNKSIGNWGEMILEEMLQRAGLKEGIHYECQKAIKDEQGNLITNTDNHCMIPDIIVHNPNQGDIIIDSKVSLSAYLDYVNAEDERTREDALKRHIESVRRHVATLASRSYQAAYQDKDRETLDFVIMFIPNEGSCQLAMSRDFRLWQDAFEKRVLIVSPVNLMALLQMIRNYWVKVEQDNNLLSILSDANLLLERLYDFYDQFDKVGKNLENASRSYQDAVNRLKDGPYRRSVVKVGIALQEKGVKLTKKKSLPKRFQPDDLLLEQAEDQEEMAELSNDIV
ncbi:MAG: DNA recombination protein RmuC [Lentisphaerae bacterium]|nr:DNA recombination protein RmuC [Lentisphaerota bacterium]